MQEFFFIFNLQECLISYKIDNQKDIRDYQKSIIIKNIYSNGSYITMTTLAKLIVLWKHKRYWCLIMIAILAVTAVTLLLTAIFIVTFFH